MLTTRLTANHSLSIAGDLPRYQPKLHRPRFDMVGSDRFSTLPGMRTSTSSTTGTMASMSFLPGSESKKGCLVLVMGLRRQRLQVSIYAKTLDPFVVFYPDKKHCRHCGVLKLKGCRVEPVGGSETDFRVIPKSSDGGRVMVLGTETRAEREEWVKALTSPCVDMGLSGRPRAVSLRQQRMPSLPEIDEICSDSSDLEEEEEEEEEESCHELDSEHGETSSSPSLPRSRHEFLHNLDKFGRRPRCCTVHTSTPSPHKCEKLWDTPKATHPIPNGL